ncbi:hypothetical protein FRB91_010769 [Serendipita sp. 411]|nr:hypothetical protein FRB91_010769 [Serendipita sp. 411]
MGVSLPYDIIVIIIRDHVDDRNALYALSLVSQSFCNIAQRVLFSTVELCYSANAPPRPNRPPEVVRLPPFKWRKLRFLARSDKLSRYVRSLIVLLTAGPGHHDSPLDEYWHQSGGRPILDELDRWLPPCLQHMSPLDKLIFVGPAIRAPVHQAILRHNTLRYLKATVRTHCVVPCRDAMQTRVRNTAIEELKFVDIGESEYTFGYLGCIESSTGPRRCAFLSHMIWTHSASLKVLRVGILLLYDALRPSSNFPDFPHLSSLHIEDAVGSPYIVRLDPEISFAAVAFILHVHETIVTLQWGLSVLEETTKLITANYLPNLRLGN